MKMISGKVVSMTPTSLSRAAKVIANFASFDNGASDAVSVYLRRASDAFNALVQFHKDLKAPHSTARKQKPHQGDNYESKSQLEEDNKSNILQLGGGEDVGDVLTERSKKKKHRKEKLDTEEVKMEKDGGSVDVGNKIKTETELQVEDGVKKRDKKKRKNREEEEEEGEGFKAEDNKKKRKSGEQTVDSAEKSSKKSKKRRKVEGNDKL